MKRIFVLTFFAIIFTVFSCSESTTPSKNAQVTIVSELSTPTVKKILKDIDFDVITANQVDSIKISRIRILMSRLKLFLDKEDTNQGREIKAGPFIYEVTASGNMFVLAEASIPVGIYDKIKFEFHRFSSTEAAQFLNHPVFKDFATDDRYSVIIDGVSYKSDTPTNFTYRATTTANLLLKFSPSLNLTEDSKTTISLQIDPNEFFKKSGDIIDPSDPRNANDIDNAIQKSIKALKK
ncbi:MAG: hypothetical protein N2319_08300 [Candidatus Kapabacteria bacterium]|nr:hypothetical protein [Candidatus Kapabacteria bacterium]